MRFNRQSGSTGYFDGGGAKSLGAAVFSGRTLDKVNEMNIETNR